MNRVKASMTGLALLAAMAVTPAFAGDVTINLHALRAKPGKLYIALQKRGEFLKARASYGEVVASVAAGEKTFIFHDVAPGEYAVLVWHDTNQDGRFTTEPNGTPLDGWSIRNGQKLLGSPTWNQVKFAVPADGKMLDLAMFYPDDGTSISQPPMRLPAASSQ
ncbi:MAG: hypothetical protein JWL96_362 [Sphingomonas bacterium]|uniref:DUF2141 domain-containing protein n=1 Tax=Sphingomonas bacterium TaxID=1895847 RepID=UPI00263275CA|nr:DUF2141 domain-containing protein [Sphingomonas bacterium]MDB5708292.1 hypothetical protein [Sphingomonas bacterium]